MLSSNLTAKPKLNNQQPSWVRPRKVLDMGTKIEQPSRPIIYTVEEAAKYLRVSRWMIYRLMRSNELISFTVASRRLISSDDLMDFIEQHKEEFYG